LGASTVGRFICTAPSVGTYVYTTGTNNIFPGSNICASSQRLGGAGGSVGVAIINNPPSLLAFNAGPYLGWCYGLNASLNWTYSDPENDPQLKYRAEIATNSSFAPSAIIYDETITDSVVSKTITASDLNKCGGGSDPCYNKTLYARVMVWDDQGNSSPWSSTSQWPTPLHAYPDVDFDCSGTCAASHNINEAITFTDTTVYGGSANKREWNFGDTSPVSTVFISTIDHSYTALGSYNVTLKATDDDSYFCEISKLVPVQLVSPTWREVGP
jgi:hypothetical protein